MIRILISILISASLCPAQKISKDTVSVKHRFYTVAFDTVNRYPAVTRWWVTKSMVSCGEREDRTDKFTKDPILTRYTDIANDYKGSGYDRGHNMPAYDNGCDSVGMSECFYFTNVAPQTSTSTIAYVFGAARLGKPRKSVRSPYQLCSGRSSTFGKLDGSRLLYSRMTRYYQR